MRSKLRRPTIRSSPRGERDHLEVELSGARGRLRSITLRLGVEQIAEARRLSDSTGVPYQVILRHWIAEGASIAQRARRKTGKGDRGRPRR
jgi:hypothetical protein